jgi:hypothetical protein
MASAPPHADDSEWQALVGKAIVRFGDIELVSLHCLAHIPGETIGNSAARLEFSRRVELLIEMLEGRGALNESMRGLLDGFARAKVLARTRNLIAHNPVMLDVYVNLGTSDVLTERSIRSARSGAQTLTLEELKEFAAEVEDLAASLWLHYLNASGDASSLWRNHVGGAA